MQPLEVLKVVLLVEAFATLSKVIGIIFGVSSKVGRQVVLLIETFPAISTAERPALMF